MIPRCHLRNYVRDSCTWNVVDTKFQFRWYQALACSNSEGVEICLNCPLLFSRLSCIGKRYRAAKFLNDRKSRRGGDREREKYRR